MHYFVCCFYKRRAFPRNFRSEYEDQEDYFKLLDLVSEFGWPVSNSNILLQVKMCLYHMIDLISTFKTTFLFKNKCFDQR